MEPSEGILHHAKGVDLIPANIELSGMEITLVNAMSREFTLKSCPNELKPDYDFILIDCMPSLGMLTINALAAADRVVDSGTGSLSSVKRHDTACKDHWKGTAADYSRLSIDGVLLTLADMRTTLARTTAETLKQNYGRVLHVFQTVIPVAVKVAETSAAGKKYLQLRQKRNGI